MITWSTVTTRATKGNVPPAKRVEKTADEWRALLTPEQYEVAREKGTERRASSGLCYLHEPGIYACVCCGTDLFDNTTKFESNSGWPSFTEPLADNRLSYHQDDSHFMSRIEVTCSTCDAHLGHVFPDGPEPTGLRYCINGVALVKKT